jgi:hypothetical protein
VRKFDVVVVGGPWDMTVFAGTVDVVDGRLQFWTDGNLQAAFAPGKWCWFTENGNWTDEEQTSFG